MTTLYVCIISLISQLQYMLSCGVCPSVTASNHYWLSMVLRLHQHNIGYMPVTTNQYGIVFKQLNLKWWGFSKFSVSHIGWAELEKLLQTTKWNILNWLYQLNNHYWKIQGENMPT